MAELTNVRREATVTVTADVTGAEPIVDSLSRVGRSWLPDWIRVTYKLRGGVWQTNGSLEISGYVLLKDGTPGQNKARWHGWRDEALPTWAADFIEAQRPTGGQP